MTTELNDWTQGQECCALDALCWGLHDAGVGLVTGYPGFHAHELIELCGGAVSVNERTAYAVAWGASIAGVRAAVARKNVGLNDAADPFLNSMLLEVNAGLVVVVFDDVEVAGSQCRQDSRPYFDLAPGLWLEPASARHGYWCAREAAGLSERFGVPVVLRVTNALLRASGSVRRNGLAAPRRPFRRSPSGLVAHPVNVASRAAEVTRRQQTIAAFVETLYRRPRRCPGTALAVRAGACETDGCRPGFLYIWTYPLPQAALLRRIEEARVVEVVEQGGSFVLEKVRALGGSAVVCGRDASAGINNSSQYRVSTAFAELWKALRSCADRIVCGDLGSYTMDPDRTVDACLCYGAGVPLALGCSLVHPGPVFAVTGDAAFLHSGQACLEEARRRGARFVVILLDNGEAVSTGGQTIPGLFSIPPNLTVRHLEHATATAEAYRSALSQLADQPGPTVLHVRCPGGPS